MKVWRIAADTPQYEADDLRGIGAERSGGRWNRRGTPLVYASTSRALACLETVVHLSRTPLPLNRYLVEIDLPDTAWSSSVDFEPADHVGWDAEPAGRVSLDWGDSWARSCTSLLARVPSVIVAEELNLLINPRHADITKLRARKLRRRLYDSRFAG